MTTETLTFDFGTTPEEVIRERIDRTQRRVLFDVAPDSVWGLFSMLTYSRDDLLTVLDPLRLAAAPYISEEPHMLTIEQMKARRLRISILAALGVTEV